MKLLRTFQLSFLLLGALALSVAVAGCSTCDQSNCNGCCDANGECQSGAATDHCGKAGASCSVCAPLQQCLLGACAFAGNGNGNGNGNGSGSTTTASSTGTDGSSITGSTGSTGTNVSTGSSSSSTTGTNVTTGGSSTTTTGSTTTSSSTTTTTGSTTTSSSSTTTGSTTTTSSSTTTTGSTGTSSTTTTGSTGTSAGSFCSAAPVRNTLDNQGIASPCTPNNLNLPDGGSAPQQGSCTASGSYCFDLFSDGAPRCWAPCSTPGAQAECPGTSICQTVGQYTDGSSANFCLPVGYSDNTGCPSGFTAQIGSPEPNDLSLCFFECSTAADCNGTGAAQFQCVNGQCRCTTSSTDCINGSTCEPNSGACIFACTSNTTCDTIGAGLGSDIGCCLQYGGVNFCDSAATP